MQSGRRLSDPTILVLASLAEGPKHGYAIQQDIEAFAGIHLRPGTLYAVIARLEADGIVKALPSRDRRRPYKLTVAGAGLARAQLSIASAAGETGLRRLGSAT